MVDVKGRKMQKSYDEVLDLWNITVDVDLDLNNVPKLKGMMLECIEEKQADIVLDCTDMPYIDSTGLGVLVSVNKHVKEYDGNILITGLKPHIQRIFKITGLDAVFHIDTQEA